MTHLSPEVTDSRCVSYNSRWILTSASDMEMLWCARHIALFLRRFHLLRLETLARCCQACWWLWPTRWSLVERWRRVCESSQWLCSYSGAVVLQIIYLNSRWSWPYFQVCVKSTRSDRNRRRGKGVNCSVGGKWSGAVGEITCFGSGSSWNENCK